MTEAKYNFTDSEEIARYIKEANKVTPVKLYLQGDMDNIDFTGTQSFGDSKFKIVFGENDLIQQILQDNKEHIKSFFIENDRRNSAVPLLDIKNINARIEPGAIIRDRVEIGNDAVIMMGAVINIGAIIGEKTLIDMGAVVGARGVIGENCHIGANAVIIGVLSSQSKNPVIIEDDVKIGANAVILESVTVGKGAIVTAGSVVTEDVAPNTVVSGSPARKVKNKSE